MFRTTSAFGSSIFHVSLFCQVTTAPSGALQTRALRVVKTDACLGLSAGRFLRSTLALLLDTFFTLRHRVQVRRGVEFAYMVTTQNCISLWGSWVAPSQNTTSTLLFDGIAFRGPASGFQWFQWVVTYKFKDHTIRFRIP